MEIEVELVIGLKSCWFMQGDACGNSAIGLTISAAAMPEEAPAKRMCLDTGRGRKNLTIHSFYEDLPGGRVRCKECHKRWFDESVAVELQKGSTEEMAKAEVLKKCPPSASVPSYNKCGTASLKAHLLKEHSTQLDLPVVKHQPTIVKAVQKLSVATGDGQKKAALAFCMNPALPFSLASDARGAVVDVGVEC